MDRATYAESTEGDVRVADAARTGTFPLQLRLPPILSNVSATSSVTAILSPYVALLACNNKHTGPQTHSHEHRTSAIAPTSTPPAAIGDKRRGEGTVGYRPPEARTTVACHPSAEAFSLAHMCLVTFTKRGMKEGNLFGVVRLFIYGDRKEDQRLNFVCYRT